MCALDRLQNKYLRLENRKSTIHTKCSLQEVAVSKSRQGPIGAAPPPPLTSTRAVLLFFIIYFSLLLLILLLFAFAVVTIIGKVPFPLSWTWGSCL